MAMLTERRKLIKARVFIVVAWALWPALAAAGAAAIAREKPQAVPLAPVPAAVAPVPLQAKAIAQPAADDKKQQDDDLKELTRGAELNRDFEADRLLRRVKELLATPQPQYRDLVVLLQSIIDRPGDAFASEDGAVFRPVRFVAERILAGLGAAGLDAYRMEADGQAKALLGTVATSRDAEALRTVVRHYFLSSHGDDAAYLLGCLHLDEHDFAKARRLFRRVLTEHPDPSVPRGEVLMRLAVACRRCGDTEGARAAWKQLARPEGRTTTDETLKAIEAELAKDARDDAGRGGPAHTGVFPPLPAGLFESPRSLAIPSWRYTTGVSPRDLPPNSFGQLSAADSEALKSRMLGRWESSALVPSNCAVWVAPQTRGTEAPPTDAGHGGPACILLRSQGTLTCLDPASGQVRWQTKAAAAQPPGNPNLAMHYMHTGQGHPLEVLQFDDQIGRAIRVIGDGVYQVEEFYQNRWGQNRFGGVMLIARQGGEQAKQVTGNVLAAYDIRTGAQRWRVGRTLKDDDELGAVQFVAAPVASAGRLIVPVEKKGELWLAGLDPANGRCAWQTFLCSFVTNRMESWRLVGLATQGSDVYVASGQGFIFSLDGTDGSLHWASQYEQDWDRSTSTPFFGQTAAIRGWRDSQVAVEGSSLIVLPSDAECVLVLDAASGKVTARHRTPGLQYCLGLDGTSLYASSAACVRRLDALTGQAAWERKLEERDRACGRGILTPDALYVPSGKCILRLDPKKGELQATIRVSTEEEEPVGNLFSDGARLVVVGLTDTYPVVNAAPKLAEAETRVAQLDLQLARWIADCGLRIADFGMKSEIRNPKSEIAEILKSRAEACFARAGLRLKYDRVHDAVEDLKAAVSDTPDAKLKDKARHDLVDCLTELARREPNRRLELLRDAHAAAKGSPDEGLAVLPLVAAHRERGDLDQAITLLLEFAQSGKGTPVELDAGGDAWKASPQAMATGAIQRLLAEGDARLAPLLARHADAALAAARSGNDTPSLRAILRLYPGTQAAIEAGLKAAASEAATGIFEKAEAMLREMARSPHPGTAAAGLAALADLYQKKGWLWQARGTWEFLAKEYADAPVALEGATKPAKELAAARLADKALAEAGRDMFRGVPEPPWRQLWASQTQPGYANPIKLRQSPYAGVLGFSQFLEQHLLFQRHGADGRLVCRRLSDGQTLYEAPMARPPHYLQFQAHEGARDGHVALLQGQNAWEGFGLVSGKTLWSRTQPAAQPGGVRYATSFAWRMNIQYRAGGGAPAGCVVLRPSSNAIRVLELATGEDRWERSFRRRQITWAQEAGRYVIFSLESGECWICDVFSGERVGTVDLGEGQRMGYPRSFQVTRRGALFQKWEPTKGGNKVSLLELPSGKMLWNLDLGQEYRQPALLSDELFYLQGGANRGIEIRDLASGAVKVTVPQDKIQGFISQLSLSPDGKKLGFWAHDGQGKMRGGTVDLTTGNVALGPASSGNVFGIDLSELWARSGDLVPWMEVDIIKEGNNIRHTNLRKIGFVRKSDGKALEGVSLPSSRADGKFENVNQLFVQDGMIILARHDGIQVFGRDPSPPAEKKP
ncbi:MAG: hypothetical protein FJ291_08355 [Planctomycetes bacterium]|nr:hypothetical protein [Planctomycetota bacterium]